jgi:hypothetical protein
LGETSVLFKNKTVYFLLKLCIVIMRV